MKTNPINTTGDIDVEKYVERIFWDVYFMGQKDAKRLVGSSKPVLEAAQSIKQLLQNERQRVLSEVGEGVADLYNPDITDLEKDEHQNKPRLVVYFAQTLAVIERLKK